MSVSYTQLVPKQRCCATCVHNRVPLPDGETDCDIPPWEHCHWEVDPNQIELVKVED